MSTVSGSVNTTVNTSDLKAASDKYVDDYLKPLSIAQIALGTIIGTYGYIKQNEIANEYLGLARDQVAQSDKLVTLSENMYNGISKATFDTMKADHTRINGLVNPYENDYLVQAFRFKKFTPDFATQEGRAIANVNAQFDRAQRNRARATGKYNTGRACHDATMFAIERAKAMTVAADSAYRYEDQREARYDAMYFDRMTRGAGFAGDLGNRAASGLNGGANIASSGFAQITNAYGQRTAAFGALDGAYSNKGNIFGSIANFGIANIDKGVNGLMAGGVLKTFGGSSVESQMSAMGSAQGPNSLAMTGFNAAISEHGLSYGTDSKVVQGNTVP